MSIQMKTYDIEGEDDICEIFLSNKIEQFNNAFELCLKNIKKKEYFLNKNNGNLLCLLEATLVPLTIQNNNFSISLFRENSNEYIVHFVNIKNESGDDISSLIDNLSANDRILLINGIKLKNSCKFYDSPKLIIDVRPEKNSSVFVLKCKSSSLLKSSFPIENNLSRLTATGYYSLFGNVIKTLKYTDEDFMLLRIHCFDKSCIKIYKYPQEFKKILMPETNTDVEYDFSTNNVDILVKNPCSSFFSLLPNQRVLLNNVKVKYSNGLQLFSLHLKGNVNNIKADPIETNSVNSIRPPTKHFIIPNELKPRTKQRAKQICNNDPSDSNSENQKFRSCISPIKKLSVINKSSKENSIQSSDDDNVNISPCRDFSTSKYIYKKRKKNDVNGLSCKTNIKNNDNIVSSTLVTNLSCEVNSRVSDYSNGSPKKSIEGFSTERKMCAQKDNSPDFILSPPLFYEAPTELNKKNQSKTLHSSNINTDKSRICKGPCRLIYFEPSLLDDNSIVCGYCTKCHVFIQKSFIKSSNTEHRCPKCSNIVYLTFFFKMIFLYGKDYNQAIEVCCYSENATKVLKKLTKETIILESYLSNQYYRKLVADSIKSFIIHKTKLNIIVKESTNDKTFILLGIDTKYVITSPNH